MKQVKTEVITIGDEILYGQIVDTNAQWISAELDKAGVKTVHRTTIGDNEADIMAAFAAAEARADVVLITGGLGPTSDDLTKPCLASYFDCPLVLSENTLAHLEAMFKKRGFTMNERNRQQAYLPQCCTPVTNHLGTAAGMRFEKDQKLFFAMPGVPFEMKAMMSQQIIPDIIRFFKPEAIHHKLIKTVGIGESWLADKIKDWEAALPTHIKLAYLPSYGQVRLRLSATGSDIDSLKADAEAEVKKVLPSIGRYVYGYDDDLLEEVIGRILSDNEMTIATAESCTGGYLAHLLTSIPGSSQYFMGSVIAYANEIKMNELHVQEDTLAAHGAVSEQTVIEMANNMMEKYDTDIALATSGIAGPGGGTPDKPVGTVWLACASRQGTTTKLLQLAKDRAVNIKYSATAALHLAWQTLSKNN